MWLLIQQKHHHSPPRLTQHPWSPLLHRSQAFYADCVKQAATHARSFCAWEDQLRAQEAYYGSCAAPRLWAIAEPSKVSVTARLTWWLLVACAEHLDWAQVYKLRLAVRLMSDTPLQPTPCVLSPRSFSHVTHPFSVVTTRPARTL